MSRIASRFAEVGRANRAAFIPFITAGDPSLETSFAILEKLPAAGADLIELGVPFSDGRYNLSAGIGGAGRRTTRAVSARWSRPRPWTGRQTSQVPCRRTRRGPASACSASW